MDRKTVQLNRIVNWVIGIEIHPNLRAIEAFLSNSNNVINLIYYHDGEVSEKNIDDFTTIGAEVIAQYSNELIDESFVRFDKPNPLPQGKNWGYIAPGEKS